MTQTSKHYRSHCPINFVLETFGDKWTLLIIRDLMFKGKRSYGEFLESDEKISTNILADRLLKLEGNGIVKKHVAAENRSKFIYKLTQKGKDMLPIMLEVTQWSSKHDALSNTPKPFVKALEHDKTLVAAQVLNELEKSEQL